MYVHLCVYIQEGDREGFPRSLSPPRSVGLHRSGSAASDPSHPTFSSCRCCAAVAVTMSSITYAVVVAAIEGAGRPAVAVATVCCSMPFFPCSFVVKIIVLPLLYPLWLGCSKRRQRWYPLFFCRETKREK